jgi:probable phosphomutase (TIGR03848 family)
VATVLLVRHGRTGANAGGILAGWTPGVGLDESGVAQAAALARRLAVVPLAGLVTSPLDRCRQTAQALVGVPGPKGAPRPDPVVDDRLGECRYGDWTGRTLKELAKEPLWRVVQAHPSAVTFPGEAGESMLTMQHRAVAAVREHDARLVAEHGDEAIWVAVSHGDVIKAVLADALGLHLDLFQRLVVDPCSVSVVRYTPLRPFALRVNDTGGDLCGLVPPPRPRRARRRRQDPVEASDAVIGGPDTPPAAADLPPSRDARGHRAPGAATP